MLSLISIFTLYAGYLNTSLPAFFLILLIIAIHLFQIKFTLSQLLVIFLFIIYSTVILISSISPISSLINLKWFYGIVIYLILFKIENVRLFFFSHLSSHKIFFFYLLTVIFETMLANLIFTPHQLYGDRYASSTLLNYNRPLGGVGNSSVTSTFIIAWYYSLTFEITKYKKYIFFTYSIVILLLMSGTGLILYIVGLLIDSWKKKNIIKRRFKKISLFFFTLIPLLTFYFIISYDFIQKASLVYYLNVLEIKFLILIENFNSLNLLGYSAIIKSPLNGSDFGWYNLIYSHGKLGFIIFILLIIVFAEDVKKNRLSILILFLGTFHYAAIFLAAGQMLLVKLITKKNDYFK